MVNVAGNGMSVWSVSRKTAASVHKLIVNGAADARLFTSVVGALTYHSFNIQDAKCFINSEKIMLFFLIEPPAKNTFGDAEIYEQLKTVKRLAMQAMAGSTNLSDLLRQIRETKMAAKPEIEVRNNSLSYTRVTIRMSQDYPGLLHAIAKTFCDFGVDVWNADIRTRDNNIEDTFFLRNKNGEMLDRAGRAELKNRLETVLA